MKPRLERPQRLRKRSVDRRVADFLHELGQLKRVARSGWWLCGLKDVESVAEHVFRTAAIAYVLAEIDGADAGQAAAIALFHDVAEARVNDAHRLLRRHAPAWRDVESSATREQLAGLPAALRAALQHLIGQAMQPSSREGRIAKDADRLECLLQAREYAELGAPTDEWRESALRELDTPAAKALARAILGTTPSAWRTRAVKGRRGRSRSSRPRRR